MIQGICATCNQETDVLVCEECTELFCMGCYCRYEWVAISRLCWKCQSDADKEWLNNITKPRRTWPSKIK